MSEETYKVYVGCGNCHAGYEVFIEKGVLIEDVECVSCGCFKLNWIAPPKKKKNNQEEIDYENQDTEDIDTP